MLNGGERERAPKNSPPPGHSPLSAISSLHPKQPSLSTEPQTDLIFSSIPAAAATPGAAPTLPTPSSSPLAQQQQHQEKSSSSNTRRKSSSGNTRSSCSNTPTAPALPNATTILPQFITFLPPGAAAWRKRERLPREQQEKKKKTSAVIGLPSHCHLHNHREASSVSSPPPPTRSRCREGRTWLTEEAKETGENRAEEENSREERKKGRSPSRSSSGQQPPAAPPSEPPQVSPLTLISVYCSSSSMSLALSEDRAGNEGCWAKTRLRQAKLKLPNIYVIEMERQIKVECC